MNDDLTAAFRKMAQAVQRELWARKAWDDVMHPDLPMSELLIESQRAAYRALESAELTTHAACSEIADLILSHRVPTNG